MESKPHLSAPAQRIGAALGCREEGAAHGGVPAMGASSGGASRHAPCGCPTRREHTGEHPPRAEGTWPGPASISRGTLLPRCLACSQHFTPFSGGGWGWGGGAEVQVTSVSQLDRPHPGLRASGVEGQGPLRDQAPGPQPFHSAPPQGGEGDAELRLCLGVVGLRVERPTPLPGPAPAGAQSRRPPHSQGSSQWLRHR